MRSGVGGRGGEVVVQISTKENIDGKIQYHTKSRLQYLQNGRKVVSDHHLGQRCGEGSLPEFGGILAVCHPDGGGEELEGGRTHYVRRGWVAVVVPLVGACPPYRVEGEEVARQAGAARHLLPELWL